MVGDRKIGSAKKVSWDFHLGMNSVGHFISVVLWTVKFHLWYISIGSTFLVTCWALLIIWIRHTFLLGKINSVPLRKRLPEDSPALTLTLGLAIFASVNKMLIVLMLKYILYISYIPSGTWKIKADMFE